MGTIYFFNIRNVSEHTIMENDEMAIRRNVLRNACKFHGLDMRGEDVLHQPKSWEYVIAKQKHTNLVWCPVFKSGTTR